MTASADTVLLTGASGFIAKHVALRLLQSGYRVRATVRSRAKGEETRRTLGARGADLERLEVVELDLTRDAGWDGAAEGCRFVQHTASPFPSSPPRDKFGLVPVARGGTLRVVEAAKRAGVERVVLTSSVVSVYHGHDGRRGKRFGEADFSNVESDSISSYAVSKTLAERAAWDALAGSSTELSVCNPALVLGPGLDADAGTSLSILAMMMKGMMPLVPKARFGIVDVRDVAEAHLRAMTVPEARNRRFVLSAGERSLLEIGAALRRAYPTLRRLPAATLPNALVRLAGLVSSQAALLRNELDPERSLDATPARSVLGIEFRSPETAVADAAASLVEHGLVPEPRPAR